MLGKLEMDFANQIRNALATELGIERFDLWFDDVLITFHNDRVRVAGPTHFIMDRIKRDFQAAIKHSVESTGLIDATVDFCVDADVVTSTLEKSLAPTTGSHALADDTAKDPNQRTVKPKRELLRAASQPVRGKKFRTFQSFVDGDCNRVARTSAEMVIQQPGEVSPLFIYGPTGTGKSHLLESIWCSAKQKNRRSRVFYLSAEQFTTYFLEALRGDGLPNFRRKYRQADVLLIDDIQFFARKQATLVELAYTIDELSRQHRQLILTADRPSAQLASCLNSEVANRLRGGLVCAMKPIEQKTMESISVKWAAERQIRMATETHSLIASRMQGDARQLSGVLNRLRATSMALQEPITPRMVNEVLYELVPTQARIIRMQDVRKAICEVCGVDSESLQQQSRSRAITQPRMLAMYLARKHTSAGLHEISQFFGRRSHSSAVTANNTVEHWISNGETIAVHGQKCDVRDIMSQVETLLRTG